MDSLLTTTVAINLKFTDQAAAKVNEMIKAEDKGRQYLRVSISGGGCSGFQYLFKLDDIINDDDIQVEKDGALLVVDPMSYQYLMGSSVDFKQDLNGSMFTIDNPNAASTCGCGTSFSV